MLTDIHILTTHSLYYIKVDSTCTKLTQIVVLSIHTMSYTKVNTSEKEHVLKNIYHIYLQKKELTFSIRYMYHKKTANEFNYFKPIGPLIWYAYPLAIT